VRSDHRNSRGTGEFAELQRYRRRQGSSGSHAGDNEAAAGAEAGLGGLVIIPAQLGTPMSMPASSRLTQICRPADRAAEVLGTQGAVVTSHRQVTLTASRRAAAETKLIAIQED
jgi:hypothetical protein